MKKEKMANRIPGFLASGAASLLCAVLFVCANTNSSMFLHQPKAPADLKRFCRVEE